MQVFLPVPDFRTSYEVLDKRRCFKQVIEDGQLIKAILTGEPKRIRNHPACRMFVDNINALIEHHNIGYEVNKNKWKVNFIKTVPIPPISNLNFDMPSWFGNDRFHSAHRAALLDKDYEFYSQYGWGESPKRDYWWPV